MDQKKEAVGMKSGMLSPVPATLHLTGACSKPLTWQAHLTARAPHAEPMLAFLPLPPGAVHPPGTGTNTRPQGSKRDFSSCSQLCDKMPWAGHLAVGSNAHRSALESAP